jgi:HAD superfamily hydrolase (TIGR01509 family)
MQQILKIKAVVFDRDGVIINTDGVMIDSVRKAFKNLGLQFPERDISQLIGRGPDVYKNRHFKGKNFNYDEFRKIQRELFYQNLDQAEFFQDTLDLIKSLHKRLIPIAITTSASREGTLLILGKCGINHEIDVLITKEDCKNLKPHPEPYILTSEKLGIEPELCLVIEDTALGVEAAKKAGMKCIAVPNEYTNDQDFSMADAIVQSAREIESRFEFV